MASRSLFVRAWIERARGAVCAGAGDERDRVEELVCNRSRAGLMRPPAQRGVLTATRARNRTAKAKVGDMVVAVLPSACAMKDGDSRHVT
jgi:hypothetical protein